MRTRRITPAALGAAAVAVVLGLGLTACNPAPGEATISVAGPVSGTAKGPKVTCTKNSTQTQRQWSGTLSGGATAVITLTNRYADRYQTVTISSDYGFQSSSGPKMITADKQGVWHIDVDMFTRPPMEHITASMACP